MPISTSRRRTRKAKESNVTPTQQRYDDGFHYQNILAPLVKLEADYDRQIKESLTEESIAVRWTKTLAGKHLATFSFHRLQAEQSRIVIGDELRLRLGSGAEFLNGGRSWEGLGYVKDIIDGQVELELRNSTTTQNKTSKKTGQITQVQVHCPIPEQIGDDYIVEYIWKSTSYDRMQKRAQNLCHR